MKKLICGLSALTLMTSPLSAYADTAITDSSAEKKGETQITMEVAPAYVLTIPADTTVEQGAVSTNFGTVLLTEARLEPGMGVCYYIKSDYLLKNEKDETKTIPYDIIVNSTLCHGDSYKDCEFIAEKVGDGCDNQIIIKEEDWENACAGKYRSTLTFVVYCDHISTEE